MIMFSLVSVCPSVHTEGVPIPWCTMRESLQNSQSHPFLSLSGMTSQEGPIRKSPPTLATQGLIEWRSSGEGARDVPATARPFYSVIDDTDEQSHWSADSAKKLKRSLLALNATQWGFIFTPHEEVAFVVRSGSAGGIGEAGVHHI